MGRQADGAKRQRLSMTMQAMSRRGSTNPTLHRRGDRTGVARMGSSASELEVEEGSRSVAIDRQERQGEERGQACGREWSPLMTQLKGIRCEVSYRGSQSEHHQQHGLPDYFCTGSPEEHLSQERRGHGEGGGAEENPPHDDEDEGCDPP